MTPHNGLPEGPGLISSYCGMRKTLTKQRQPGQSFLHGGLRLLYSLSNVDKSALQVALVRCLFSDLNRPGQIWLLFARDVEWSFHGSSERLISSL
jgi:hypothetical protein